MNRDNANRSNHGSYVQLNTFDEKEKSFVQTNSALPPVWPYKRCLCTKRDAVLVGAVCTTVLVLVAVSLSLGLPRISEKRALYLDTSFPASSAPLLTFDESVVVTDGKECARIGKNISASGGSAVDAALAALICDGVVNPQSMGLGGGFLMTVYLSENQTATVVDARETAPQSASKDMFDGNKTLSQQGGLSIAVPGELRGYQMAHEKFGKLPWRDLVLPSVQLCEEGFEVSEHLADKLRMLRDRILSDESMREEFVNNATGDLFRAGEVLRRPALGATLSTVAREGADALYTGSLHQKLLEDITGCGGTITASDLAGYRPLLKPALRVDLTGPEELALLTSPLPGSGPILGLILNVLGHYNMSAEDFEDVLAYHRTVEAFKFAFAHRTQLGDDAFVDMTQIVENLMSGEYARIIREQISDHTTFPTSFYKPVVDSDFDHGTAHVSVLAANGDAVSVTSTINTYFGSLCRSRSTGVILNNAMDDFSSPNITNYFGVPPSPANAIAPGKRPLSSMCPSVLLDSRSGKVRMVAGGAGGTRIITATAMGIIRSLWLHQSVKEATDAPRIHHQLFPNYIEYEKDFPQIFIDQLRSFGHSARPDSEASVFLGIVREGDRIETNVDHRKGGSAAGF